jgi:hypothetical protein
MRNTRDWANSAYLTEGYDGTGTPKMRVKKMSVAAFTVMLKLMFP